MITVLLSTYNGGERLRMTLEAMTRVRSPRGGWRLIAVDNRSTDDTPAILQSYAGRLPLDVLQEPSPGKNRALNRGLEHALSRESDLYIFCDDDVLVDPSWLEEWRSVADANPDYGLFAGRTAPSWPSPPPRWILEQVVHTVVFTLHDSMPEGPCDPNLAFGTNMAVRADAFKNGARFNGAIGPDGSASYAMGSETEFVLRMTRLGLKTWFANGPAVRHIIRPEQLSRAWILQRGYRYGRGTAALGKAHPFGFTPAQLAVRNRIKQIAFPPLMAILPTEKSWRYDWRWAFDRGFEDGLREHAATPARAEEQAPHA